MEAKGIVNVAGFGVAVDADDVELEDVDAGIDGKVDPRDVWIAIGQDRF